MSECSECEFENNFKWNSLSIGKSNLVLVNLVDVPIIYFKFVNFRF